MSGHRMYYSLKFGPAKPKDDLGPDEGLADGLLLVSIMGTPGAPEPLSLAPIRIGPAGPEALDRALAYHVAMAMLHLIDTEQVAGITMRTALDDAAHEALGILRQAVVGRGPNAISRRWDREPGREWPWSVLPPDSGVDPPKNDHESHPGDDAERIP